MKGRGFLALNPIPKENKIKFTLKVTYATYTTVEM
jgi:hypothetical protein